MGKILIIDDDADFRQLAAETLCRDGYEIMEAANGKSGLKLARDWMPDLVLSDIRMDGSSGFDVLKGLRSQVATSAIPVILMTGMVEGKDMRQSMEWGADDFLPKPFADNMLSEAVRARLQRQHIIQEQAKENEVRLLEILAASRDLVALVDAKTSFLSYLNRAGRRMLGIGDGEDISRFRLEDFEKGVSAHVTGNGTLPEDKTTGHWTGESEFFSRDGRHISVAKQILAHYSSDRQTAFWSIVASDITERKRAEAQLNELNKQLIEASREAGKAEIATSVLHNAGNVLNSVNVCAGVLSGRLKNSKLPYLKRVAAMMKEHENDLAGFMTRDPGGATLPTYLGELAEQLTGEQTVALDELAELHRNIEHIKNIVTAQQSFARTGGPAEKVQVTNLVEDALRMNSSALGHRDIQVIREFHDVPGIVTEKHKVLQILVNLLRNATQACDASGRSDKQLTVRVTNGDNRVRIAVDDNGIGILPENLSRIFERGFTTKKDGHGFGLHSCLQAAREIGGALLVHSDKPGNGACFTLELPVRSAPIPSTQ
jgi:PAS domain S-box-containing protein